MGESQNALQGLKGWFRLVVERLFGPNADSDAHRRGLRWADILWIATIALVYFLVARFSLSLIFQPEGIAAIWPPSGIFLSSILLTRRSTRPYLVAVLFLTDLSAEILAGIPPVVSLVYSAALTGDALLSAWLLLRFAGAPITFGKIRHVIGFILLSLVLSNALAAVAAALVVKLYLGAPFWSSWFWWWSSDGVGNLMVTPLILSWAQVIRTRFAGYKIRQAVEFAALIAFMLLVNSILLSFVSQENGLLLLDVFIFPFLIWAAWRLGVTAAVTASLTIGIFIVWSAITGGSSLIHFGSTLTTIILVQLYLAIACVLTLFLAALITERKQAEEELRQSEDKFKYIFENSPVGKSITRPSGEIQVNNAFCEMLGYSSEELKIKKWQDITHPDDIELTQREVDALLTSKKEAVRFNKRYLRKDGGAVWTDVSSSLRRDPDGKPLYLMTTVVDITEQKRAEEELKRSNSELEQFAYVTSHDLQEPLRMVSSYLQLLERRYKGQLDQSADEFIGFAVDGAGRMQRMINDLLAFSRLGTHGKPFAPTSCESVLHQALDNLQVAIQENQAQVTHAALPTVLADESQLVQLFQNLIGNAIKFHGKERPLVHISAEEKAQEWVFAVRDNGIGIDPQYAERIFIIFQRLHNHSQYPGTGIGLAMCKKIVQRHGGRIWVESSPGSGATFYFTLDKVV